MGSTFTQSTMQAVFAAISASLCILLFNWISSYVITSYEMAIINQLLADAAAQQWDTVTMDAQNLLVRVMGNLATAPISFSWVAKVTTPIRDGAMVMLKAKGQIAMTAMQTGVMP